MTSAGKINMETLESVRSGDDCPQCHKSKLRYYDGCLGYELDLNAEANRVKATAHAASTPQHSPLPWTFQPFAGAYNADGFKVADCDCSNCETLETKIANAEFIVKACNSYPHAEALAEAYRDLCDLITAIPNGIDPRIRQLARDREALAQWKRSKQ
jgi:hypothetical protein